MSLKRRESTREFKLGVIREIDAGKSSAQVARKYQLDPSLICKWRKLYQRHKDEAFAGRGRTYSEEARIAELKRLIGRLTIENDLLKKALRRLEQKPD
jgi:transposase